MASNNVIVLDKAVLPEAQAMAALQRRTHDLAELLVTLSRLVDNQFIQLLESTTKLDLHTQSYQFDPEKGYLIPQPSQEQKEIVEQQPHEPIPLAQRRTTKKRS